MEAKQTLEMSCQRPELRGALIVALRGVIDLETIGTLEAYLRDCSDRHGERHQVLNLQDATAVSPDAAVRLKDFEHRLRERGWCLLFVNAPKILERTLWDAQLPVGKPMPSPEWPGSNWREPGESILEWRIRRDTATARQRQGTGAD